MTDFDSPERDEHSDEDPQESNALQRMVLSVISKGVGPVAGSVDYAHARLRDENGGSIPVPEDPLNAVYEGAGSSAAERAIQRIRREAAAAAGTNGFLTGLGGFVTLPVVIPANIAGVLIVNARLVGAIAYLRGYKLTDPHTQAMAMLVVAGTSAQGAASLVGIKVGANVTKALIRQVPISVIRQINKRVGFMLVAKYGTTRATVTLAKSVPIVGGLAGGAVDATLTGAVGRVACRVFPSE
ncbi:EcsC family protein [uncultured Serinicoccus sp.]|uniref:EcsC family protein n=1 Tax=uncultured Serinicoccus sp. TaxID=735514 RepID=UPI00261453DF|nr:EcsC family protein [uncultured Serinicoccus sp.]